MIGRLFILIAMISRLVDLQETGSTGRHRIEPVDVDKRLPEDVVPSNYVIAIAPDFRKDDFHGSVRIDIEILNARSYIVLHSSNLTVLSTKLYSQRSQAEITIKSVTPIYKREMIVIKTLSIIPSGQYSLRMNFSGSLKGKVSGFYLSKYTDPSGSIRKLATTQFEPFFARTAFPCFDEPRFKSTFLIRILHTEKPLYRAMSNMPVTRTETMKDDSSTTVTYFELSPPMSTYLVAFLVSDFECLESSLTVLNGSSIPVNVCVRPMYKNKTRFALDVAVKTMEYYLTVFNIDYPLPKLDLVGIPDFNAGAMENWGLVTFRETELLHTENDSSTVNTRSVCHTVAHELAHMWFGDLVTLSWWNDLWLNEGFATYMEHMALDFVFPQWNQAAAVIRMLEDAIGNSRFIYGIRDYLLTHRFRNAASRDLFEILQNSSRTSIDIVDFMNRWTSFPGFPVINLIYDQKIFRLSQRRFVASKKFHETLDDGSWTIPVKYITSRMDGVKFDWFLANFSCVELTLENRVDWIKLNHRSVGYYVVNYTEESWNIFGDLLRGNHQALSPTDRADLLHDAFLLADASSLNYATAMNLTVYLSNETSYQPWAVVADWFSEVNRLLGRTKLHNRFQIYARRLVDDIYHRVGWRVAVERKLPNRELGLLILHAACSMGHEHCLKIAGKKLRSFLDGEPLRADIRSVVYPFGLAEKSVDVESIFEKMSELLAAETDAQERDRLIAGLAGLQDKSLLTRYLERATDDSLVRKQDFAQVLIKMAAGPVGVKVVWDFVRSHWDSLREKYVAEGYNLGKAVLVIVSLFKDRQMLHEVRSININLPIFLKSIVQIPLFFQAKEFFRQHSDLGVTKVAKANAIEEIENSIDWLATNKDTIDQWLATNGIY
ncbi:glutamyl aminopeptidase isoform X2 [Lasioglossum baleicum]|uniref:glutamyl aminopeptidase isoform X2 n=1 Tax=Lasioglossum baleicum TaxID=434251 RepID=UPI003FCDCF5C